MLKTLGSRTGISSIISQPQDVHLQSNARLFPGTLHFKELQEEFIEVENIDEQVVESDGPNKDTSTIVKVVTRVEVTKS